MIAATNLSKQYGDHVAVNDLSFEIDAGETFGLLGPNGAGKTTTINMLVGLLRPDRGTVTIGNPSNKSTGSPLDHQVRRRIGIAPQTLSLYDELTARENLEFFGSLYGLSRAELKSRRDWSLEFAGLADRQKDRVSTFSGGMKRRLNIAAAMMHQPDILLLDEPTVGVDPQSRNHIFDSIQHLQTQGLTMIYTTHYMEEAQRLCKRVAIVDRGRLMGLNTVDALIDAYGGDSVVSAELKIPFDATRIPSDLQSSENLVGNSLRFTSDAPLERVAQLTGRGLQFQSLNISRPNLERVFLTLTGRSLRD